MWDILILFFFVVLVTYWLLNGPYNYWKKKGVPGPNPKFLVGNLGPSVTLKQNLGQVYKNIYDSYPELLYVGYYKFRTPGILMRDVDLIRDVLIKGFSSFHDNDIHVNANVDPLFAKNPFCLVGDEWKVIRSQITSAITQAKVKNMFTIFNNVNDTMINYMKNTPEVCGSEGIEAKELAAKYATDVIASCAFGLDAKSFENPKSEFREMGKKFMNQSFWMGLKHMLIFILPSLASIMRIKFIPKEVEDWLGEVIFKTIRYREENQIIRNDYLDLLISLKSKPNKYGFTDTDVLAQAMVFYGDGFETSAITLCFALYEIAAHPEIQDNLYNEIITVLEQHKYNVTYDAVQEMDYLDKIISESLRLHTPDLFLVRKCTEPYELPPARVDGKGPKVTIQPGTPIVIPLLGLHYDRNLYDNPEKFDPERFSDENKKSRPKCAYLAFGEGPRICFGTDEVNKPSSRFNHSTRCYWQLKLSRISLAETKRTFRKRTISF